MRRRLVGSSNATYPVGRDGAELRMLMQAPVSLQLGT